MKIFDDPHRAWADTIQTASVSADIVVRMAPFLRDGELDAFSLAAQTISRRCILGGLKTIVGRPDWADRRDGLVNLARTSIEGWGWVVRVVELQPTITCLIVDSTTVLLSPLVLSRDKGQTLPLVVTRDPGMIATIRDFFDHLWNAPASGAVLYEDLLASTAPDVAAHIVIASSQLWEQLIPILARHPERVRSISPRQFEELVAELLLREGLKVQLTQPSRDGGRDVLAWAKTAAGDHLYLVECKKYNLERPVGVSMVRALYGTVSAENATSGLLVTTSRFTRDARAFQHTVQHRISLRDHFDLDTWLKKHGAV